MGRTPLSKKTRFEVFKRDSFTCQYCGKSAPEVILEVDHVVPVAEGGTNDLFNLVTSCRDCNRGKGKVLLSDHTVLEKQKAELDALNEKREQLEMMVQWREELMGLQDKEVDVIEKELVHITGFALSNVGKANVRRLLKQFELSEILEAIEIAYGKYYRETNDYYWNMAFNKIGGICYNRKKQREAEDGDL